MTLARMKRLHALEREEKRDRITVRRFLVTQNKRGELVRMPLLSYTLEHGVKTVREHKNGGGAL